MRTKKEVILSWKRERERERERRGEREEKWVDDDVISGGFLASDPGLLDVAIVPASHLKSPESAHWLLFNQNDRGGEHEEEEEEKEEEKKKKKKKNIPRCWI